MRTHLDVYEPAWDRLTNGERMALHRWITEVVGPDKLVRGVELTGEGAVRIQMYVDAAGEPAAQGKDIHIERPANEPATAWFDYFAAEPPLIWPE